METTRNGKEIIILVAIFVILIASAGIIIYKISSDTKNALLTDANVINTLLIIDHEDTVVSTNVLSYCPATNQAAMFDIPSNTGLIFQKLNRTDGIAEIYREFGAEEYRNEVSKLTGITIPFHIIISASDFSYLTDLLGGISVFIPTPVDMEFEGRRVLLPSGVIVLDGEKVIDYLTYRESYDEDSDVASRRQKAVLALLHGVNDNASDIFSKLYFEQVEKHMRTNVSNEELKLLLENICRLDSERLVPQRVTGSKQTTVDGKELLFPFQDGRQFKDVVKQALAALPSEDGTLLERIYALEILNGTEKTGLARSTKEIYESFGYDVVVVGNAQTLTPQTVLIDRIGNEAVAKIIAEVIRCPNIQSFQNTTEDLSGTESAVDFTLILGEDFNGYYVKSKPTSD